MSELVEELKIVAQFIEWSCGYEVDDPGIDADDAVKKLMRAIAALRERVEELEGKQRWIPVEEKLPEEPGEYFCKVISARNESDSEPWMSVEEFRLTREKAFGNGWNMRDFDVVIAWAHPPTGGNNV